MTTVSTISDNLYLSAAHGHGLPGVAGAGGTASSPTSTPARPRPSPERRLSAERCLSTERQTSVPPDEPIAAEAEAAFADLVPTTPNHNAVGHVKSGTRSSADLTPINEEAAGSGAAQANATALASSLYHPTSATPTVHALNAPQPLASPLSPAFLAAEGEAAFHSDLQPPLHHLSRPSSNKRVSVDLIPIREEGDGPPVDGPAGHARTAVPGLAAPVPLPHLGHTTRTSMDRLSPASSAALAAEAEAAFSPQPQHYIQPRSRRNSMRSSIDLVPIDEERSGLDGSKADPGAVGPATAAAAAAGVATIGAAAAVAAAAATPVAAAATAVTAAAAAGAAAVAARYAPNDGASCGGPPDHKAPGGYTSVSTDEDHYGPPGPSSGPFASVQGGGGVVGSTAERTASGGTEGRCPADEHSTTGDRGSLLHRMGSAITRALKPQTLIEAVTGTSADGGDGSGGGGGEPCEHSSQPILSRGAARHDASHHKPLASSSVPVVQSYATTRPAGPPNLRRRGCYVGLVGNYRLSAVPGGTTPAGSQPGSGQPVDGFDGADGRPSGPFATAHSEEDAKQVEELKSWLQRTTQPWTRHSSRLHRMQAQQALAAALEEAKDPKPALPQVPPKLKIKTWSMAVR